MANQKEATLLLKIKRVGEDALTKTGEALEAIGKIATVAFAAMVGAATAALHAWREQESATNALNQTLVQQGIYTRKLSQEYQDMATELSKVTTYGDEAIVAAQSQAQAYLGQTKITKELTQSILDFATRQGVDATRAAELFGKSIGTR